MTEIFSKTVKSQEEMGDFARKIALETDPKTVLALKGDLGVGKSFFARTFINSLSEKKQEVLSPTFNLVYSYDSKIGEIFHFDLYRLKNEDELENIGFFDSIQDSTCLIEWPEIAQKYLPKNYIEITIETLKASEESRKIIIKIVENGKI